MSTQTPARPTPPKQPLPEPVMTRGTITPEIAEEMLTHNIHNRPANPGTVTTYARLMSSGDFMVNGDSIRFDVNGVLLDGQQRLMAVIMSGVPLKTWIVRNLPPEAQATMDTQRKRSAGDVLALAGVPSGNAVAATVRMVYRWDQGERSMLGFGGSNSHLTPAEVQRMVESDPSYIQSAHMTRSLGYLAPGRATATLFHIVSRVDQQVAVEFCNSLISGADLQPGSPILTLTKYWSRLRATSSSTPPGQYLMGGIRAWNAYVEGRPLTSITYRTTVIPEPSKPRLRRIP